MANAWMLPLLLAMTCVLAACQSTSTTLIGGTEKAIVAGVCRAWQPTTYSSRDTPETQMGNRANNASRDSYCGKGN